MQDLLQQTRRCDRESSEEKGGIKYRTERKPDMEKSVNFLRISSATRFGEEKRPVSSSKPVPKGSGEDGDIDLLEETIYRKNAQ